MHVDQHLEWVAPKCWSKYTTQVVLVLNNLDIDLVTVFSYVCPTQDNLVMLTFIQMVVLIKKAVLMCAWPHIALSGI